MPKKLKPIHPGEILMEEFLLPEYQSISCSKGY